MSNQELIELYNPANSKNLTAEQLEGLKHLTPEQLKALAEAYPNQARKNSYLLIFDKRKPLTKQAAQISTFQNVSNLINKFNQPHWSVIGFTNNPPQYGDTPVKVGTSAPASTERVDLTADDLKNAEGLKTGDDQNSNTSTVAGDTNTNTNATGDNSGNTNTKSDDELVLEAANKNVADAQAAYDASVAAKEHPNRIKSLEKKLTEAKDALTALTEQK